MDDIITGAPLGARVRAVTPMNDYMLYLEFTNGEKRIFDAKQLFSMGVFKPLQNKTLFEAVKVAYGSVLWPSDIDYCPDTLYMESVSVSDDKLSPLDGTIFVESNLADEEKSIVAEDSGKYKKDGFTPKK